MPPDSIAERNRSLVAVIFIDLDGFKAVNDALGHQAGDSILQEVARRLELELRRTDTIARIGGDEFVALISGLSDERRVLEVAQKLLAVFSEPFRLAGRNLPLGASIGVSIYPKDAQDALTLLRYADIAMYSVKAGSKNRVQSFEPTLKPYLQLDLP